MTSLFRKIIELVSVTGKPKIHIDEYDLFFHNKVWLAMRQAVSEQLDSLFKQVVSPIATKEQIYEARGAIRALSWILEARDELKNRIEESDQRIVDNSKIESRLQELFDLMEEDYARKRNRNRT